LQLPISSRLNTTFADAFRKLKIVNTSLPSADELRRALYFVAYNLKRNYLPRNLICCQGASIFEVIKNCWLLCTEIR